LYIPKEEHSFSDEELQLAAQRVANVYSRALNRRFRCHLPVPARLSFTLHQDKKHHKSAGVAYGQSMSVNLNMPMLREYPLEMLNETIPHELVHLVETEKFGNLTHRLTGSHGPEFCMIMRVLGKEPERKHRMDPTSAVLAYREYRKVQKQLEKLEQEAEQGG